MSDEFGIRFKQGSKEAVDPRLNFIMCIMQERASDSRVEIGAGVFSNVENIF